MPPKLTFRAGQVFHPEYLVRNKVTNLRLGLPVFGEAKGTKSKLAVVGGGPEVVRFRDDLRSWDGEIWAINGAFGWCLDNGIPATFFSLDASDALLGMAQRATAAILADHCNPSVVAAVSGPVQMIDLEHTPLGATSAASVPMLAAINGNPSVTLFGCESSFTDREHAYSWSLVTESRVLVECGGQEYLTTPQLIMQAEYLADIARRVPGYVTVKGSGFLPALIEHGDYEVVKVSRDIAQASGGAP
jgi:hypothetical protein